MKLPSIFNQNNISLTSFSGSSGAGVECVGSEDGWGSSWVSVDASDFSDSDIYKQNGGYLFIYLLCTYPKENLWEST